jgi:hypothetical protein
MMDFLQLTPKLSSEFYIQELFWLRDCRSGQAAIECDGTIFEYGTRIRRMVMFCVFLSLTGDKFQRRGRQ